jgi:hypothetical protein
MGPRLRDRMPLKIRLSKRRQMPVRQIRRADWLRAVVERRMLMRPVQMQLRELQMR